MKKTFKLVALSLLSLLLVGCQKTNDSGKTDNGETPIEPGVLTIVVKNKDKKIDLEIELNEEDPTAKIEVEVVNSKTSQAVTYTSSNEKIVSVAPDGTVTGHWRGEATITVTSVEDSTKTAQVPVTVTDLRTVSERWEKKLSGDIKLEGGLIEIDSIKDKDGKVRQESSAFALTTTEYSSNGYHFKFDAGEDGILADATFKKPTADEWSWAAEKGYYCDYKVDRSNIVGPNGAYSPSVGEIFKNPFAAYQADYKVLGDDEENSVLFTIDEDEAKYVTAVDTLVENITALGWKLGYSVNILSLYGINSSFNNVVFEEDSEQQTLSINFTTPVDDSIKGQAVKGEEGSTYESSQIALYYDVIVDAGEVELPKPFEETDESKKLDAVLKTLSETKNYSIKRKSQAMKSVTVDDKEQLVVDGNPKVWDVMYTENETYSSKGRNGIVIKDGKHYRYKYDDENTKNVDEKSIEALNGKDGVDAPWTAGMAANNIPVYSGISAAAVFNSKVNDDKSITYTARDNRFFVDNRLSDNAVPLTELYLFAERDEKQSYISEDEYGQLSSSISDFTLTLTEDNKLSLSYTVPATSTEPVKVETYEYNLTAPTIPTFTEKAPTNLVGDWELASDATAADGSWEKAGLTLEVSRRNVPGPKPNDDTITSLLLFKGGTRVGIKEDSISVFNKVISFELSDGTKCSLQMREGKAILTIGETEYSLVQKGLPEAITNGKATINGIDVSKLSEEKSTECPEGEDDSDKAVFLAHKAKALEDIDKCTTVQGVKDIVDALQAEYDAYLLKYAKADALDKIDKLIASYDSHNGTDEDYSDQELVALLVKMSGGIAAIEAAKTVDEVEAALNSIADYDLSSILGMQITINDYLTDYMYTMQEKKGYVDKNAASLLALDIATKYSFLSNDDKATLSTALETLKGVLNQTETTDEVYSKKFDAIKAYLKVENQVLLPYMKQSALSQLQNYVYSLYDSSNGLNTTQGATSLDQLSDAFLIWYQLNSAKLLNDGNGGKLSLVEAINGASSQDEIDYYLQMAAQQVIPLIANSLQIPTLEEKKQALIAQYKSLIDSIEVSSYTGTTNTVSDSTTITDAKTALATALTAAGESLDAQLAAYVAALNTIMPIVNRIPKSFAGEFTATNASDSTSTKEIVIDGYKIKVGDEVVVNLTITTTGDADSAVTVITFDTNDGKHWKLEVVSGGLTLTEVETDGSAKTGGEVYNLVVKTTTPDTDPADGTQSINFHFSTLRLAL